MADMRTDLESCDWCGAAPGAPCLAADGTAVQAHYRGLEPRRLPPHPARVREDTMYADLTAAFARILATPREPGDQAAQLTQLLRLEFDVARRVIR